MYQKVIVTGSIAYDEIMDFPGFFKDYFQPDKLHQINVSFVLDTLEKQIGGIATNIAYNLSLVTKTKVQVCGAVGRDGEEILKFLKSKKINTDAIFIDRKLYTSTGRVITDKKDNQIWGYYYGAAKSAKKISIKKFVNRNSIVIISPTHQDSFLKTIDEAISAKVDYMFDPGFSLSWITPSKLLKGVKNCKYLIGNDYEIALIMKMIKSDVKKLVKSGIAVITTLGDKGVIYSDKDNTYNIPSFKVRSPLDPTGAGDAWRGGFVGALVEGQSIKDALIQANALASFAVEHYGTVNHNPQKLEIHDRIKRLKKL